MDRHTADFKTKVRAEYEGVLARAAEERARGLDEVREKRHALQEEIEVRAVAMFCVVSGLGGGVVDAMIAWHCTPVWLAGHESCARPSAQSGGAECRWQALHHPPALLFDARADEPVCN